MIILELDSLDFVRHLIDYASKLAAGQEYQQTNDFVLVAMVYRLKSMSFVTANLSVT